MKDVNKPSHKCINVLLLDYYYVHSTFLLFYAPFKVLSTNFLLKKIILLGCSLLEAYTKKRKKAYSS